VPLTKKEIGALMKPLAVEANDKLVAVWGNIKTNY